MKLFEIINPIHISTNNNNYIPKRAIRRDGSVDDKFLGNGLFSSVFDKSDDSDPNTVIKYDKRAKEDSKNAFIIYAEEIYQKELWNNPHFPRIYKTIMISSNGRTYPRWEIEKLHEIRTLTDKHAESLIEKYFDTTNDIVAKELVYPYLNNVVRLITILEKIFTKSINHGPDIIIYEPLLDAVEILFGIKNSNEVSFDIHEGNIMFRHNNSGGDIVFSDPFF